MSASSLDPFAMLSSITNERVHYTHISHYCNCVNYRSALANEVYYFEQPNPHCSKPSHANMKCAPSYHEGASDQLSEVLDDYFSAFAPMNDFNFTIIGQWSEP